MTTDHICHCAICAASRAFDALLALAPLLPDHAEKFETAERAFNAFLDDAASREMDAAYGIDRIASALLGRDVTLDNGMSAERTLLEAKKVVARVAEREAFLSAYRDAKDAPQGLQ